MAKKDDLRRKLIQKARKEVKTKYVGRESHIIRAADILSDLDEIFNLLYEDSREWYGIHFPEMDRLVKTPEIYLNLVNELGLRKNFSEQKILKYYKNKEKAKQIETKAKNSVGSEIEEKDLKKIQSLAKQSLLIKKEKNSLVEYVEKEMKKELPNFSNLCGAVLGAKLLSEAGAIEKMVKMPASTIQVLGAEKALFRHLKSGAKPPKYGLLFQHPFVQQVKTVNRGKMARSLASKLSIALKQDFFSKKEKYEKLLKELEKRASELS